MFMEKQHSLYSINPLLSRIPLCRNYALFGGHFWPKSGGRGHANILYDRALHSEIIWHCKQKASRVSGATRLKPKLVFPPASWSPSNCLLCEQNSLRRNNLFVNRTKLCAFPLYLCPPLDGWMVRGSDPSLRIIHWPLIPPPSHAGSALGRVIPTNKPSQLYLCPLVKDFWKTKNTGLNRVKTRTSLMRLISIFFLLLSPHLDYLHWHWEMAKWGPVCTLHGCSHLYVDIDCDRICDGGLCCDNAMNQVDPDCDFNSNTACCGSPAPGVWLSLNPLWTFCSHWFRTANCLSWVLKILQHGESSISLSLQSGAHRRGEFRDFQPIPSIHPAYKPLSI